ncbi:MAG: peptide deformylase [Proteobacteria bacterium]|nr:peptide deformylase [Pseudomonadota bacterium]
MAILPIYEVPHPILKQVAKPVAVVDDRVRTLLDDMAATMYAAPGIGLAAPQVGVSERILVTAVPVREAISEEQEEDEEAGSKAYLTELINPEILEQEGAITFDEGCLSVPDLVVPIDRWERIVVRALDRHGEPFQFEARGFYAVVFQHEIDHIDGKTLVDRLSALKRAMYLKKQKKRLRDGPGSDDDAAGATA